MVFIFIIALILTEKIPQKAGCVYFIFDNSVERREKQMKEGWPDTSFLYCFSVHHPFFFVLLLIGGL